MRYLGLIISIVALGLAGCAELAEPEPEASNPGLEEPPPTGEVPQLPPMLPPDNPDPDPEPDPPEDPPDHCGELDGEGECADDILNWCEGGAPRTVDCAALGRMCAWSDIQQRFFCVEAVDPDIEPDPDPDPLPPPEDPDPDPDPLPPPEEPDPLPPPEEPDPLPPPEEPPPPEDDCPTIPDEGICMGDISVICAFGIPIPVDCMAVFNEPCGWVWWMESYGCGGSGQRP